jgi:pyruvate dehydrogenase E1 component
MDSHHIVIAALAALADEGTIARDRVAEAIQRYGVIAGNIPPWEA